MTGTVRITVAPGCHISIAPHPSGLPGMPALVLHSGNTAYVTPSRAAELYAARLILDPATGALPPPYVAETRGLTMQVGDSPRRVMDGTLCPQPGWERTAEPGEHRPILAPVVAGGNDVLVRALADPYTDQSAF